MAENLKAIRYTSPVDYMNYGEGVGDLSGDPSAKYYFWYQDDSISFSENYGALYT